MGQELIYPYNNQYNLKKVDTNISVIKHLLIRVDNYILLMTNRSSYLSIPQSNSRVATSSFKAQDYERPGVSSAEIQQIKESFDLFDSTNSGVVYPTQLQAALASLGSESLNQPIFQMISDLVDQGHGEMDFNQFLDLMTARVSTKDTRDDLKKVFNLFDDQKKGFISINNLKKVIRDLGENIEEHELTEMIEKADQDHDGLVSEEEFYNIMTRKIANV